MKSEIRDKGSEALRCCVKTTHLLNVLHLSLPDNLLGFKDAELLSSMVRKNPALRILNLEKNRFCSDCGFLFGDALQHNENLKSLDLSHNRLGDLGVRNLVKSLVCDGMNSERAYLLTGQAKPVK